MAFQRQPVRSSTPRYRGFNLAKDSSTGFWSTARDSKRPFRTRFRCGSPPEGLTSPRTVTRGLIMQKACGHSLAAAPTARGHAVSGLFHSPPGVLFTFPSRYWFAIGHRLVFSLGGWAPRIRTGFHVSRPTWELPGVVGRFGYGAITLSGGIFQSLLLRPSSPRAGPATPGGKPPGLGSCAFARNY